MKITKVEYVKDYKLKLWFNDKKIKIVDLEADMKRPRGVFIPLKDFEYFKQVTLDDSKISICWPNGADICPDLLYEMGKDFKKEVKKSKPKVQEAKRVVRRKQKVA